MKKFSVVFIMFMTFLLVGCDKKNEEVDLSKNSQVTSESYGEIVHSGEQAKNVVIKNLKMADDVYALSIGVIGDKKREAVALICDLRTNDVAISYNIKTDNGYVPYGQLEFSIMKYRPGLKDIREADEAQSPVFSTANGDNDFIAGLSTASKLPKDTVLAFAIDKADQNGNFGGIAWSPLFTAEQLLKALPDSTGKCTGAKLNLDGEHLVPSEKAK